jgi:hypothetical protein
MNCALDVENSSACNAQRGRRPSATVDTPPTLLQNLFDPLPRRLISENSQKSYP